jgi:hypothetical protein
MTKGIRKDPRSSKIIFKTAKQLLEEQENSAGLLESQQQTLGQEPTPTMITFAGVILQNDYRFRD